MFPDEKAREGDDITMYEVPGAHAGKKSKHLGTPYIHVLCACGCHNIVRRILIVNCKFPLRSAVNRFHKRILLRILQYSTGSTSTITVWPD